MLSFTTEAWLLGLLIVPVIRWLHRGGAQLRSMPVASLTLWRKATRSGPLAGERRPPDPAWRRRALAAALLSVALAGPRSAAPVERITLWVDDSLSMLTREAGVTRLETGLAKVASELTSRPRSEVQVRALGNPWRRHDGLSREAVTTLVRDAGKREPTAAPAGLLRADRRHWLLTDGADVDLVEGPTGSRFSRVFRVGEVTRNVGLVHLSARRSLGARNRLDLELQVSNGGDTTEERVAILATESGEVARASMKLEPGTSATLSAVAPMTPTVQAQLEPGDALADDDTIALATTPLISRRVAVDPACPAVIVAALHAHPSLAVTDDAAMADLSVECGSTAGAPTMPRLRFLRERPPVRVDGPLLWSSSVEVTQRRSLDSLALWTCGLLSPPGSGDTLLLASGSMPLIIERRNAGSPLIETALDTESADRDRPVAPLLVSFLVDEALSTELLDAVAVVARDDRAVRIVPRDGAATAAKASGPPSRQVRGWTTPLLVAAALVLLWELTSLLRRRRRERVEGEAWSS